MKGLGKILSRYAASAVGIGIFLLALNLVMFVLFFFETDYNAPVVKDRIRTIATGLVQQPDGTFTLSAEARQALDERYVWAMQLDDDGNVVWSDRLPKDMDKHYTSAQIAAFSRWYLHEYPVYVWGDDDGLLVLASPVGSEWKYPMTMNAQVMNDALRLSLIHILGIAPSMAKSSRQAPRSIYFFILGSLPSRKYWAVKAGSKPSTPSISTFSLKRFPFIALTSSFKDLKSL